MRWRSLIPTEHQEQVTLIDWCQTVKNSLPEAALLFAIPNGGTRPWVKVLKKSGIVRFSPEGLKLQREGVRSGVPDLFLPVPRQEWHGLFIEMKRLKGTTSLEQDIWIGLLTSQGYAVTVCRGAEDGIHAIRGYLTQSTWHPKRRLK